MKNSSSQPGRFGPLGAFGIAWRRFWLLRLGTWIQLLVPVCIQDLAPHINSTETEKSCCTEPSRVLQGGGLPSFLWLPLVQLLLDFFWLISWPHFFFFLPFVMQKLKPLICLLLHSFPAILVWFPTRGEANAWTQLPSWTWNPIILTLFKFLRCLQYDSICYSLISELLETLPKALAIRIMYWIGLLLNKESLKYFNAKKIEVHFSPVWQV